MTTTAIVPVQNQNVVNLIVRQMNDGKFAVFHDGKFVCASMHYDYVTYNVRRGRHAFIAKLTDNFNKPIIAHTMFNDGTHEIEFALKGARKQKPVQFKVQQCASVEIVEPVIDEQIETAQHAPVNDVNEPDVIVCPSCGSTNHKKNGKHKRTGAQAYRCKDCNKNF